MIAEQVGGAWPARARRAAETLYLSAGDGDNADVRLLLLADLRDIFLAEGRPEYISTADLLKALNELEERVLRLEIRLHNQTMAVRPWRGLAFNTAAAVLAAIFTYLAIHHVR